MRHRFHAMLADTLNAIMKKRISVEPDALQDERNVETGLQAVLEDFE